MFRSFLDAFDMRTAPLVMAIMLLSVYSQAEPPVSKLPGTAISQLAKLCSDGIAQNSPEFRHVKYGHFFEEDSDDAIAMFSVEGFGGGNGHSEYIAFFQGVEPYEANGAKTKPYMLVALMQIGGRWWRSFDWKSLSIAPGAATISGKAWRSEDAGCCPTAPFTATFRLKDNRIVESD